MQRNGEDQRQGWPRGLSLPAPCRPSNGAVAVTNRPQGHSSCASELVSTSPVPHLAPCVQPLVPYPSSHLPRRAVLEGGAATPYSWSPAVSSEVDPEAKPCCILTHIPLLYLFLSSMLHSLSPSPLSLLIFLLPDVLAFPWALSPWSPDPLGSPFGGASYPRGTHPAPARQPTPRAEASLPPSSFSIL